jgi:hypothetical protein
LGISVIENDAEASGVQQMSFVEDEDTYTAAKKIEIKNTGSGNPVSAYVRVCIFPKYDNDTADAQVGILSGSFPATIGDTLSLDADNPSFTMGDVTFYLAKGWSNNWLYKDGYFYYKATTAYKGTTDEDGNPVTATVSEGVLPVGYQTAPLLESVSVNAATYNDYVDKGALLRVVVLADSIQTVGGAVTKQWSDSGLKSLDVPRPTEATTEATEASALSLMSLSEDDAVSDSVFTAYVLTAYEKARVESMISKVSVSVVYTVPKDEEATEDTEDLEQIKLFDNIDEIEDVEDEEALPQTEETAEAE